MSLQAFVRGGAMRVAASARTPCLVHMLLKILYKVIVFKRLDLHSIDQVDDIALYLYSVVTILVFLQFLGALFDWAELEHCTCETRVVWGTVGADASP